MRRPGPNHKEAAPLEGLSQVQYLHARSPKEKWKCVAHAHTTGRLTALRCVRQIKHQRDRSLVLFASSTMKSFHLKQRFPNSALRSSILPISTIPPDTMSFLPSRHLRRTQQLPPTNHSGQKRDRAFARNVLRNQEKHRRAGLLRPSPTLLYLSKDLAQTSKVLAFLWRGRRTLCAAGTLKLSHATVFEQSLQMQSTSERLGIMNPTQRLE